ncbi:MAG: sugar ABC transporter ATP-binding protein [Propionibacteriaceae bacterium]|jgi:ABC-type sugar transport system ATPase subunit|nr:sugar ABC transporter ATP-binding protein [Propionibacteriaceae bacterium]
MPDIQSDAPEPGAAVELRGIRKSFGGVHALREVDLVIPRATVIGLVGENGAGKSTLLKVLSGTYTADAGTILVDGQVQAGYGPAEARAAGISMVTQELSLFPHLTVADNIVVGREPTRCGLVAASRVRRRAQAALDQLQSPLSVDAMVRDLPFADRQTVEIAKALVDDPRVLVLDEPTSGLRESEVDRLMDVIRRLRDEGRSVIFITHRMSEFFTVCDSFVVMKDGVSVGTRLVGETNPDELVSMMVGRQLESLFPLKPAVAARGPGQEQLALTGFRVGRSVGPVDLSLFPGEILGIAGLAGNGQNELLEGIAGLRRASGVMTSPADARRQRPFANPGRAVRAGYALVPEDRKGQGVVLSFPVYKNVTLAGLRQFARAGVLSRRREFAQATTYIDQLKIHTPSATAITGGLSGGNQQKVVLAKALNTRPTVLLLSDPTRGIDVGTKQEIYALVRRLAGEGVGILFLSTDLTEIVGLCDRVLVMSRRRIVAELAGAAITEESITRAAFEEDL